MIDQLATITSDDLTSYIPIVHNLAMSMYDLADNVFMWGLVIAITFDYITGMAKSMIWKVNDSQVGIKGLVKHALILLAFLTVYPFAGLFQITAMVNIVAMLYIASYVLSIIENFGVMGIYVPSFLENKIKSEIKRYEKQLEDNVSARDLDKKG